VSLEILISTIYSHLIGKIGLKNLLLHWVPHKLTSELLQKRIQLSSQLLRVFESQQRIRFRDIVTGDESWFLQHYGHRQIWCISADEVPIRVARTIAAPKTGLTVFLRIDSAILSNWLTPGKKVNSGHFCEK
jgi:hypothetical protein